MAILFAAFRRRHSLLILARHHLRFLSTTTTTTTTTTSSPSPPFTAAVAKNRLRNALGPDIALSMLSAIDSPETSLTNYRHVIGLAVRCLARAHRTADIEAFIDSQKSSPRASQEPFVSTLILAYGTAGMLDRAISLFEQVPTLCSAPPTLLSFNALVAAHIRAKHYEPVSDLFTNLSAKHSIVPDAVSYGILVKSLCSSGKPAAALEKVAEMEGKNVRPTNVIYTTIFNSLYKEGMPDEAEKLWTEMVARGCQPDLTAYNIKVMHLAAHGSPQDVEALISQIKVAGLKPDAMTYNHLITSYCKNGQFENANRMYMGLFKDHSSMGCGCNAITFKTFLYWLCEKGDLDSGLRVFRDAVSHNKIPDLPITSVLVEKLVNDSREGDAKLVFGEVKRKLPKDLLGEWIDLENRLGLNVEAEVSGQ